MSIPVLTSCEMETMHYRPTQSHIRDSRR